MRAWSKSERAGTGASVLGGGRRAGATTEGKEGGTDMRACSKGGAAGSGAPVLGRSWYNPQRSLVHAAGRGAAGERERGQREKRGGGHD
eukprot:395250-Hanusia_phi.AAC.1